MRCKSPIFAPLSPFLFIFVFALLMSGCGEGAPSNEPELIYRHDELTQQSLRPTVFSGPGDEDRKLAINNSNAPVTYRLAVDSGDNPMWRLYFLVTNTGASRQATPKISLLSAPPGAISGQKIDSRLSPLDADRFVGTGGIADDEFDEYGLPAIEHAYFDAPVDMHPDEGGAGGASGVCGTRAPNNSAGDTVTFYLPRIKNDARTELHATARVVRTVGEQRVVFWAPDAVYHGCEGAECLPSDGLLTDSDVEDVADTFLKDGTDNDIYDWMGAVFGASWGPHDYCGDNFFISADHRKQVDILLYNIGDRTGNQIYNGGVLGYYASANNYSRSAFSRSNERLLLAVHAPWVKVSNRYLVSRGLSSAARAREKQRYRYFTISVLVHEYQHLINFYQRFVLDGADPRKDRDSTWLNEQFSLMAEDLLYQHFASGISSARDYRGLHSLNPGRYGICSGRIPSYLLRYGARGVSQWEGKLWNYAINFSFGAYLLRNYNAAQFISDAYHTQRKSEAAISYALDAHTSGLNMGEAIRRWGVAVLLSDRTNAPSTYKVNNGRGGFASVHNGTTYKLGSINYYNYRDTCSSVARGAFRIFNTAQSALDTLRGVQDGHANIIVAATENLRGSAEFKVTLSPGQALTAVSKRVITRNNPIFYGE